MSIRDWMSCLCLLCTWNSKPYIIVDQKILAQNHGTFPSSVDSHPLSPKMHICNFGHSESKKISQFHPVVLMFSLCMCRWLAWGRWHVSVVSLRPSWRRVSGSTHSHPGHLGWWHFSTVHGEHTYCIHTLAQPLNAGLCVCDNRHHRCSSADCASHIPSSTMAKPTHIYTLRHTIHSKHIPRLTQTPTH